MAFQTIAPADSLETGFRAKFNQNIQYLIDASRVAITDAGVLEFFNQDDDLIGSVDLATALAKQSQIPAAIQQPKVTFYSATPDREGTVKITPSQPGDADENKALTYGVFLELINGWVSIAAMDAASVGDVIVVKQDTNGRKIPVPISRADFIKSFTTDDYTLLCEGLSTIGCGGGSTPQPSINLRIAAHFEEQAILVEALPNKAAMDSNTCTNISGWVSSATVYPAVARIVCDGLTVGYQTATLERPDVRNALNTAGANTQKVIFGFNWIKPSNYLDGVAHTWQVFVGDTSVEATDYNVSQVTTCGTPPTTDPYVVYVKQSPLNSLTKGGAGATVALIEVLSDGSERSYSGSSIAYWNAAGDPAGIVLTPGSDGKTVTVSATNAATVANFKLQCTLTLPQTVQVLAGTCTRPTGLTTYQLSWHFIPDGGFARLYTTLDDANATAGQKFDGSAPGSLDPFIAQAASLNVGQSVYLGDTTSCEKVGDNIYYAMSADGANTILRAIQVINGVIVAVKDSTYVSPTCTGHAKLTQAEYDAHTLVFVIYNYLSAAGIRRSFASHDEAVSMAATVGNSTGDRAMFTTRVCFPEALNVGNVLYGDNRPEHIADHSWTLWPVEAGWWISNFVSATDFYVIQTDACGNITSKEHITL